MPEFPFARLRRFPDVEAPELQAWDATDELLLARAQDEASAAGIAGDEIVVLGDSYGALTLGLTAAGFRGVRVHQDLVTGRRALEENARALGLSGFVSGELEASLFAGARLVLLRLPKELAALAELADAVARGALPDVILLAGGRVKHMTLAMNEVLAGRFALVQPQLAARKSRLIVARDPLPLPQDPPAPQRQHHPELDLTLCAFGGAFAGPRIDIGTRVLLEAITATPGDPAALPDALDVVDLGCGTGALAAAYARTRPEARVVATDRSAAAVRSAVATRDVNGLAGRIRVTLDDAGSALPDGSAELVLLNPPFHLGASVDERAGRRLIAAAARLLRPGGEVWTVFNGHLDHRRALSSLVGPTSIVRRTPKFVLTRSVRRGGEGASR